MVETISFSHPSCYANCLGDCSNKITKEHYISENILNTFETIIPTVGFERAKKLHDGTAPASSFSSKILCGKHNTSLSEIDTEAGLLFNHLRKISKFEPCEDMFKFNGPKIERWFLKYILGVFTTGQFSEAKLQPSRLENLVRILFNKENLWVGHGLYLKRPSDNKFYGYQRIGSETSLGPNRELLGIYFDFHGYVFYFSLIDVIFSREDLRYRPKTINFNIDKKTKSIEFDWGDERFQNKIDLSFLGIQSGEPPTRSFK